MTNILLSTIPIEELKTAISEIVKSELREGLQTIVPSAQPTDLLTRKETASILGISLPTLHEWTLAGKLPAYRIGTRVRYKRAEVEQS